MARFLNNYTRALVVHEWEHAPIEKFLGVPCRVHLKYTFKTTPKSDKKLDFTIIITHTYKGDKGEKPFRAKASNTFEMEDYKNGVTVDGLFNMLKESSNFYAQEFYKRVPMTNLQAHKIPHPNFEYYKETLKLCLSDIQQAKPNSRDNDNQYSEN